MLGFVLAQVTPVDSMTGPSSNRDKVEESSLVGWVIPRLSFLRVLVRHYVVTEVHFGEFLEALFKRYDRYVREGVWRWRMCVVLTLWLGVHTE